MTIDHEHVADFLRWFIERYDKSLVDKDVIVKKIDDLKEEMMASFDELQAKIDAGAAQTQKVLGEIKAKIDELSATQITPAELTAAVEEAKAAQSAADKAAVDAERDVLLAKLNASGTVLQELDDLVADAVPPPVV